MFIGIHTAELVTYTCELFLSHGPTLTFVHLKYYIYPTFMG